MVRNKQLKKQIKNEDYNNNKNNEEYSVEPVEDLCTMEAIDFAMDCKSAQGT